MVPLSQPRSGPTSSGMHCHPDQTDHLADQYSCVPDEKRRKGYLASKLHKLALLSAPDASAEACIVAGKYVVWLFLWDDEVDREPLSDGFDLTSFAEQTAAFIHGVYDGDGTAAVCAIGELPEAITAFREIGEAVNSGHRPTAKRFFDLTIAHVQASAFLSNKSRNRHKLTVQEYFDIRIPDSAAPSCLTFAEYVYGFRLPDSIFDMDELKIIIRESAIMVQTINDILYLAKEVRYEPDEISLIPVLMQQEKLSAEDAMARAVEMLKESQERFKGAETCLVAVLASTAHWDDVRRFIQSGKDLVMACLQWSYHTPRYMEGGVKLENGAMVFELGKKSQIYDGSARHAPDHNEPLVSVRQIPSSD